MTIVQNNISNKQLEQKQNKTKNRDREKKTTTNSTHKLGNFVNTCTHFGFVIFQNYVYLLFWWNDATTISFVFSSCVLAFIYTLTSLNCMPFSYKNIIIRNTRGSCTHYVTCRCAHFCCFDYCFVQIIWSKCGICIYVRVCLCLCTFMRQIFLPLIAHFSLHWLHSLPLIRFPSFSHFFCYPSFSPHLLVYLIFPFHPIRTFFSFWVVVVAGFFLSSFISFIYVVFH